MSEARLSILVTFYNQEEYVDKAFSSIFEQKVRFGFKILVGDDGSSDNTCAKVKEWINRFPDIIELYVMDRNPGKHIAGFRASKNRLNLLKYIETEYFTFLDGDDYFSDLNKLQRQLDVLDCEDNQDCVACAHDLEMIYPDGKSVVMKNVGCPEGKYNAQKYWKDMYCSTDSLVARSSVIETINVKLLENNFNDNMITYVIICNGLLYYIPEPMGVYFQTGTGIWSSGKVVVNLIRNMFLYDLCNQVEPKLRAENQYRFRNTWFELLKIRKQIENVELNEYRLEAVDKNMMCSLSWIDYNALSLIKKQRVCIKAICIARKLVVRAILSKMYHTFVKKKDGIEK